MSVGVDIEEVARFKLLIRNKRFLDRIFTPQEMTYCKSKKNVLQHFAVRFAAKEAIWKAMSEVLEKKDCTLGHRDIGIKNSSSGKPEAMLPKKFSRYAKKLSVSLSHTRSHVVAVAVLE